MRRFEKFLFFYSMVAVTIFFVSFGLFSPRPLNFISGILMLPFVFYFFIRLTSPETVGAERWSLRFLVVLVTLSALGIYGFYLTRAATKEEIALKNQLAEATKLNEELKNDLAATQEELAKTRADEASDLTVKGTSIADLLTETPPPSAIQRIAAKTGVTAVDVYFEPSLSSKKIGSLEAGPNYPYLEKQGGWYRVILESPGEGSPAGKEGWVSDRQVQEL